MQICQLQALTFVDFVQDQKFLQDHLSISSLVTEVYEHKINTIL